MTYAARRARGRFGEELAARAYQRSGYAVLARNWRTSGGELDLVVAPDDRSVIVFVEVKARASEQFGRPELAVDRAKQQRIRRLAVAWMRANGVRSDRVRFDVAAVVGGHLRLVRDAF
ncbi:MAG: YraN family protein [Actinomycetota bacterium]